MLVILPLNYKTRSCTGRAGLRTPSVLLHMFLGLLCTRTGSLKSPTSMGSVTRTTSSFQPYVLSSPDKRTASKSIFRREDPSRQRGIWVQWHLLQWQASSDAGSRLGPRLWPSVCWPLRRTKCRVKPARSLQGSGAGCCFFLHICKATADFGTLSGVSFFGEIMLKYLWGPGPLQVGFKETTVN